MRPLVSYDDISWPATTTKVSPAKIEQPPSKKRKKSHHKPPKHQSHHVQHWDDPASPEETMSYGDDGITGDINTVGVDAIDVEEEEESRELTYEEIWDDSALIDAWNAATEEYEAYHGTDKDWKKEPVHKSPLWYNVPLPPSKLKGSKDEFSVRPATKSNGESDTSHQERDSYPVNFDTFVPDHDPSLALPIPPYSTTRVPDRAGHYLPEPPGPIISQDEAFTRALDAMYLAGYYSAIYHCQRNNIGQKRSREDEGGEQDDHEDQSNDGDDDLIPTQR